MAVPLNGGLLILLCVAPPFSALLYWAVPGIYPWLNADPEVIEQGVPYLQARVLAMFFMGANFAFRGYWNAIDLRAAVHEHAHRHARRPTSSSTGC
jgi:multidrug resistance protein, MATE family